MPVYNAEKYIREAIASVLSQNVELEIIAIDDASSDSSAEILRELAANEPRIKAYYNFNNVGVAAVRNLALEYASGEYLAFCDADDTVPDGAYSALLGCIKNKDIAIGAYKNAYDDGRLSDLYYVNKKERKTLFGSIYSVGCLWTKLFRCDFVKQNALVFDTTMKIGEDVVFLANVVAKNPTYAITDSLVYYHWHHDTFGYRSLTHIYTLDAFKRHIECRERLIGICASVVGAKEYVYIHFSAFLTDFLAHMSPGIEREEAFLIFKKHILEYDFSKNTQLFFAICGVPLDVFYDITAENYFELKNSTLPREVVWNEFRCGLIGFRWIWKYFLAWVRYKLKKHK